jgi:hypothetical protein
MPRPSLRELLGVWLVGAVGEILLACYLVKDAETVMTAPFVAAGLAFVLAPPFLVVYSLVWAWPVAVQGDRTAISALVLFAVVVEAMSGWFWIGVHAITATTVLMRVLAVFSPLAFGACAVSAAWGYGRKVWMAADHPDMAVELLGLEEEAQGQFARDKLMAMLLWRARNS